MMHTEDLPETIDKMTQWLSVNAPNEIKALFDKIMLLTELSESEALGYTDNPMYAEIQQVQEQ